MFKFVIFSLGILLPVVSFSQSSEDPSSNMFHEGPSSKFPVYFGIQTRPIFPIGFIEPTDYSIGKDGLETRISQRRAFTVGGVVRMQFTDVFGLETGIHFTHRNFDLGASIPDSSIAVEGNMTFIEYEIPVNGLISIKLSDEIFMTSAMGAWISFRPTDSYDLLYANERHLFLCYADRKSTFGFGLNANLGFEYRTRKSGFFYLGGSAHIPLQPLFQYELIHEYDANTTSIFTNVDGAFLSLDFKYFFPLIENRGKQFIRGPIE